MTSNTTSGPNSGNESVTLVPPQLPPFLANMFHLKPIVGNPSREEVKLVHEAVRALNNFLHTPELRDTDLSTELSQYLFDVQMACHRQKYPVNVLPNDVLYNPPALPHYVHAKLKPVTGPPSNEEIASVHNALRIFESFANVPSMFDPDAHAQLSQHLFDIQLARHVQRSILKRPASDLPNPQSPNIPDDTAETNSPGVHIPPDEAAGSREIHKELCSVKEVIVEMGDTLKNVNRVLVGSQNSLARGLNSSSSRFAWGGTAIGFDLGVHSLINDRGEVPETYNLPTFKHTNHTTSFPIDDLSENVLARYLRFYGIGEEILEGGESIKRGKTEIAKGLLRERLSLNRK